MSTIAPTKPEDIRQRASALIEEAGALLQMLPKLLDDNAVLRAEAEAASKGSAALKSEAEALRAEIQKLRAERDDLAEIMARLAPDMSRLGEIFARARGGERKSPFSRDTATASAPPNGPAPSPAAR